MCNAAASAPELGVCVDELCDPPSDGSYDSLYVALRETGCSQCFLLEATADRTLEEVIFVCATSPARAYRKSLGLMLLSKYELGDTEFVESDTFFPRGAIAASILGGGRASVRVACTHLESAPEFTLNGTVVRTLAELQRLTLDDTLTILGDARNTIIAGDFNAGKASRFNSQQYDAEVVETIEYLEQDLDYKEAYTRLQYGGVVNGPTWDPATNLAASLQGFATSFVLDNVYVRGPSFSRLYYARRFLDESCVEVDLFGNQTFVPVSDHYGSRTSMLVYA